MNIFKKFRKRRFDPSKVPTLMIPTRNRPESLNGVLEYLVKFYPGTRVVIADGSEQYFQPANEENCARAARSLDMTYTAYPDEMPLIDRLDAAVSAQPEGFYVFGADDDYPILETLAKAKNFIEENPDYCVCGGYSIEIRMDRSLKTKTRMLGACSIEQDNVSERCRIYADHDFATYYGVISRSNILSRYERVRESFLPGFGDYMIGFHDLCKGKVKVLDDLAYIRSSNYTHSYVRPLDRLGFLRETEKIFTIQRRLVEDLQAADPSISEDDAKALAEDVIREKVHFLTRPNPKEDTRPEFEASKTYFSRLVDEGSEECAAYRERMDFVRDNLQRVIKSEDNKFESSRRLSMDSN